MPTLEINNNPLYYEWHGKGSPLILIGGFVNHIGIWQTLLPALSTRFRVLALDNRGAGRSGTHAPYSIKQLSDDVARLMDTLSIKSAPMIGLSMGTLILQQLALSYPQKIEQSVLISPFSHFPVTARLEAEAQLKLLQANIDPALAFEVLLPWLYSSSFLSHPSRVQSLLDHFQSDPYPPSIEGYKGQLLAMSEATFTDKLATLSTRFLLIAGEEDLCIPPRFAHAMLKLLTHAELKMIPSSGHLPHIENPDAVLHLILTFLDS